MIVNSLCVPVARSSLGLQNVSKSPFSFMNDVFLDYFFYRRNLQKPVLPVQSGILTIRQFIPETCAAIYQVLKHKYLKVCVILCISLFF